MQELRQLVEAELAPYQHEGVGGPYMHGAEVAVAPESVAMIALVLHELATNAAKHGALSVPEGRVDVRWRVRDGLRMEWLERGGPEVHPPKRKGLGSSIIEHTFTHEFDGSTKVHFDPEGLRVELWLPSSILRNGEGSQREGTRSCRPRPEVLAATRSTPGATLRQRPARPLRSDGCSFSRTTT